MDIANSLIETGGIVVVALIGFVTVVYQVKKGRDDNTRDHSLVMDKLNEVSEELQFLDEDIQVIDAKIDAHLQDGTAHKYEKKKTGKKK